VAAVSLVQGCLFRLLIGGLTVCMEFENALVALVGKQLSSARLG